MPFQLRDTLLPSNIFYAPLAGCSDFAFRKMSSLYKPGLMFCEMVKMDALIRNDRGTFEMLCYEEAMRPIGGQLCGSKVELAAPCARIIEDLGFDTLDFNCGCPVDKVTKDGSGSGMLKNPEKIGEIIHQMASAVKIPVTVKIRAGWDDSLINCVEVTKIAEQAGASAICIHGRTREQAYRGPANWDHIKACKAVAQSIKVIGNGDLFDAESVRRMLAYTGCDAALIARGTMGQPWIVEDVTRLLSNLPLEKRGPQESLCHFRKHYAFMKECLPERKVILDIRRVGPWYIKSIFGASEIRQRLNKCETLAQVEQIIDSLELDLV